MAEPSEQTLTVEIERTGERFDVLSYSLTSNYLTPADAFEFTVYSHSDPASLRRTFAPLRRVKLYVDGVLQLLGRIDETEGAGESGAALTVRGRDYVAEIVDGGADPSMRFTAKQDLGDALLMLFRPFGIRTLVGNWNLTRNILSGKIPFIGEPTRTFRDAKLEDFKIGPNMGTHEVADKLVARHGFMIQSGGRRDTLAVVEPQYGQDPCCTIDRAASNVLRGSAKRNYGDVPTVTIATGREAASNPGARADPMFAQFPSFGDLAVNKLVNYDEVERIVDPARGADELFSRRADWKKVQFEAEDFVLYRPMFYEDKDARTQSQLDHGIRRELSRRLKDTLVYSATMRGHTDPVSGAVYTVDTMATVLDEFEDVNEIMWMLERTLFNDGSGPKTSLQLIRAESVIL